MKSALPNTGGCWRGSHTAWFSARKTAYPLQQDDQRTLAKSKPSAGFSVTSPIGDFERSSGS